jgi:signal transduction histidine kinase/ActR/RegA family two-component response regulator
VSGSLELEAISSIALEATLNVLGLDAGTIRYLDENTQEVVLLCDWGLPQELSQEIQAKPRRKLGQGLGGIVAQSGEPVVVKDLLHDTRLSYKATPYSGFQSYVALPLKAHGRVVGTISGFSRHRRTLTPAEMEMMASLGNMVGMAIANARLYEERERRVSQQELAIRVLERLDNPDTTEELLRDVILLIREHSDCEAVGIRLQEGEDFPYYLANGFVSGHVEAENRLCVQDLNGRLLRDDRGKPVLECMCGNIIRGRFDPERPFFTPGGSFWTNSTTELLAATTEEDWHTRLRNRCDQEGYESVALIPLRAGGENIGLLQLNDRQRNRFSQELIEFYEGLSQSIGVALDRQRAEEEREKLEAQVLQLEKMEAVGRLAGGVAHDFNNLLTVIIGCSDLLLSSLGEDDPLSADVKEIKRAGERAVSLTRQLLTFSRRRMGEPKILNPNDVIAGTEEFLRRLISDDIELVTVLEPRLEGIKADPGQIEQVIMNLAINAHEAMPGGGRLTIKTENITLDETRSGIIPEARPGRFVCLSVEDTGVGMGKEILGHIFEPFFSTKEAGTGLGLSVVYGIVKQHEGWINVSSKPGQGATFRVYLPAVSAKVAVETEGEAPSAEFRGNGQRILVVEDEGGVRAFASKVLGDNGYVVFEAADAEEAMAIFEREKGEFHLVFSDVVLPDTNGLQLADELLSRHPGLPMLMTSGYSDQKAHWPIIKKRKFPFLKKPWAVADLLRSVKEAMAQTKEHGHR